jgi:hypothetical protein
MESGALVLPSSVYYVAGAIILTNLGAIVTIVFAALKATWWASKLDSRVTEAKAIGVRAHKRIDHMEGMDV